MKPLTKETLLQLVKFGVVGICNTLIYLAVYYAVIRINTNLFLLGNAAGFLLSVANAFFWNNRFVFRRGKTDQKTMLRRLVKSYLCYGAILILSSVLLYLEVHVLGWSETISPLLNLLITIPLNFILNKRWTFRDEKKQGG